MESAYQKILAVIAIIAGAAAVSGGILDLSFWHDDTYFYHGITRHLSPKGRRICSVVFGVIFIVAGIFVFATN